jgi:DNA-binding SARP family transcriptional activator
MLGPLQLWTGTAWTGIRAAQQRLALAVLLVKSGQIVTTDRHVDELWEHQQRRTATATVQVYVMRLRRMLEGSPIALETRGHGYQLLAGYGAIDASLFERGAELVRRSLAAGKTLRLPKTSAVQITWHARIRGGCRPGARVFIRRGG